MKAVEVKSLRRKYGQTTALADCQLAVEAGRIVGLVGAIGAGKTTLLRVIAGRLKPTAGTAWVFDKRADTAEAIREVSLLPQGAPLYPDLSVAETLAMIRDLDANWRFDRARERVSRVGLPLNRPVRKLSGGQRAELAFTLALCKPGRLMLLDEPLAHLDPLSRQTMLTDLMADVAETGRTVILSSHLVSDLERVCDDLVVMRSGTVAMCGEIEDLIATHRVVLRDPAGGQGPRAGSVKVVSSDAVNAGSETRTPSLEELVLAQLGAGQTRGD